MRKLLLIVSLLMVPWGSHNLMFAQEWDWALSVGGANSDQGRDITTDIYGNIFATGIYSSESITFGDLTLQNDSAISGFMVKFNEFGEVQLGKSISNVIPLNIISDFNGNVLISGYFEDAADFDGTIVQSIGGYDYFIAKYDNAGNLLWVITEGGLSDEIGGSMAIDSENNIYLTGYFMSAVVSIGDFEIINNGILNAFVIKYNEHGEVLWAKSYGGTEYDYATGISMSPDGTVLVSGSFRSPSFNFASTQHHRSGWSNVLLLKYDSDGNEIWARTAGIDRWSSGWGVQVDSNNNIYQAGEFNYSSIKFGSVTVNNTSSSSDLFIVKYDSFGNVLWAKNLGGAGDDFGGILGIDGNDFIYLLGKSSSSQIGFGNFDLHSSERNYNFITKLDRQGDFLWAIATGGQFFEYGQLTVHSNGNAYLINSFDSQSITIGDFTFYNNGHLNVLIASLASPYIGIEEISLKNFILFPNPFSNKATLFSGKELHNATLTITNALGQVVKRMENLNGNSVTINRESLVAGIYYWILAENQEVLAAKKISIQ